MNGTAECRIDLNQNKFIMKEVDGKLDGDR